MRDPGRWIERLRRRDEAAFNELVRAHQVQVYRVVAGILGDPDEAEDVAQEVFITAFKAIDGFRGDAKLSTWLYRIAVNHAKNRIKYHARRAARSHRDLDESLELGSSPRTLTVLDRPDQVAEGLQAERLVQRALDRLDGEQRQLIVLRDLQHLSYQDIQEVTGLPEGTVKSRLHRARAALHHHFVRLRENT